MFRSTRFYAKLGEDVEQLAIAALVGAVALFFPTNGLWHPLYGCMLLATAVVAYLEGAYLSFKNGGQS